MTNVRKIHVDWYGQHPPRFNGGPQLAYQGDHLSNMVVFDNAPELPNYYLLVEMKTDEAGPVVTLPEILLEGAYWVIPNYYTQICQKITYQVCCKTGTGDFEHHSAKFEGTILPVIKHNGEPVDQSPMFDPYIDILDKRVDELIVAAGDIQIDSELKSDSGNPVQNRIVKAAIDGLVDDVDAVNGRLQALDERIADDVTEDLGNSITPTWTSGKYIRPDYGTEGNNTSVSASDFIPLEVNGIAKTITFTTWLVNTMCVGLYREDKSFISGISVTGSQIAELSDTVSREDAAYIRITCYNNKIEDGFKVKYTDMNSDHVADGSVGGEQIANKAITNEKLFFNRQIPTTNKLRGYTAGGYISATTGNVNANETMLYTDYIPLEEGKTYYARGFNGTYNAFYDADFAYVAGCTLSKSKFTVPEGQYIVYGRFTITSADAVAKAFVYENDHLPPAYREELYATDFDIIADKTVTAEKIQFVEHDPWTNYIDMDKVETGFYIKADGDKAAGSGLFCSDYIKLEEGVTYYANEVAGQYCAFYDEDYVYVSSFQRTSILTNYAFTLPTGAKYVRVSWPSFSTNPSVSRDRGTPRAYGICQKSVRNAFNDVIPTDYTGEDIGLFNKILCCGDSLTAGGFNNDQGISIVNTKGPLYCWPTQLGKLTGCGITNKSISGLTTPGWWSAFGNDDLSGHDAAIISLGVNDGAMLGGFTEEVETAYRNIISKLETENKGIKIFLTTVPHAMSYGSSRTYSAALIEFAESLNDPNVIIIDMNLYSHLLEAMAYNCGHLSAYGYWRLAADYKAYISWYMATHKEEFRFIQFVGTDYTYSGGGATTGEI